MSTASKQRRPTVQQVKKAYTGITLAEFRAQPPRSPFSAHDRLTLLDGLETMLEGAYTHLPLKRARYGFDPVQRLRILRMQVEGLAPDAFDAEVDDIINRLRDFHTVYSRPGYDGLVAALPCIIELYFDKKEKAHYIASNVSDWGRKDDFKAGVEVDTWNGVPIERAVQRYAEQESAGRADSMRSAALWTLTQRPLETYSLPDEDTVTIGFRQVNSAGTPVGKRLFVSLEWRVLNTRFVARFRQGKRYSSKKVRVLAMNPTAAVIKKARLLVFASQALRGESKVFNKDNQAKEPVGTKVRGLKNSLPDFLSAEILRGFKPGADFGYLRLWDFEVPSVREYLAEMRRLLALLPARGLILDVRGNPGGYVVAAELALQFFTPKPIEPTRFAFLATDLNRRLAMGDKKRNEMWPWLHSLKAAVRNGELYSASLPITIPNKCNLAGQVYGGPVILIADTDTYSAGDLFSAGFVDNGIGRMVCVGDSTGAGGASVWTYAEMRRFAARTVRRMIPPLPKGGGLQFSFMRATRVGPSLGALIEDVGVSVGPPDRYRITRDDLLCENRDLIAHCIGWLDKQPYTVMACKPGKKRGTVEVITEGLNQLDVMFDHHRMESLYIKDGKHTIEKPRGTHRVEVCGLRRGRLTQRRILDNRTVLEG